MLDIGEGDEERGDVWLYVLGFLYIALVTF